MRAAPRALRHCAHLLLGSSLPFPMAAAACDMWCLAALCSVGRWASRPQCACSNCTQVKNRFADRKQVYDTFLDIMKEFKAQRCAASVRGQPGLWTQQLWGMHGITLFKNLSQQWLSTRAVTWVHLACGKRRVFFLWCANFSFVVVGPARSALVALLTELIPRASSFASKSCSRGIGSSFWALTPSCQRHARAAGVQHASQQPMVRTAADCRE